MLIINDINYSFLFSYEDNDKDPLQNDRLRVFKMLGNAAHYYLFLFSVGKTKT